MAQAAAVGRSGNPYDNPQVAASFDSMEGLPTWVDPTESPAEQAARSPWQATGNRVFETFGSSLPGLALALSLAAVGTVVAEWLGMQVLGFNTGFGQTGYWHNNVYNGPLYQKRLAKASMDAHWKLVTDRMPTDDPDTTVNGLRGK